MLRTFFVFKQKTAYEMRISDWSSDVCSSDLIDRRRETLVGHSFGGLLGVHAWLTRPALFDHVVVVSPSFWFGDGFLAREAAIARDASRGTLVILTGEREGGAVGAAKAFVNALPDGALERADLFDLPDRKSTRLNSSP